MNISKINHSNQEYVCGLGKAKINLYNGKLGFEFPLISLGVNNFRIGSSLVYNSQYKCTDFGGMKIGLGNGWKLNLHQYVFPYLSSYNIEGFEVGNYVYIDANWNIHKFVKYKSSSTYGDLRDSYYDSDGTGLKLLVGNNAITQMFDQYNNTYLFDDQGRMIEIISGVNVGITKKIVYTSENLTSIYDPRKPLRKIQFSYNSDGTLKKAYTTVNNIGFNFKYNELKLDKVLKYCSSESKEIMEFIYNSVNRIEYAISSTDLTALKFNYTSFEGESVVKKVCCGAMKKTILTEETDAELYVGEDVYLGEENYVTGNGKRCTRFALSMPIGYVKEEIDISYNRSFTQVTNNKVVSTNYYFNMDGTIINYLEYKDGKLFSLSNENGWMLSSNGTGNSELNGQVSNILDLNNNYTYVADNNLLQEFKNIFKDLNNDSIKEEEFSEHFNVSFWMKFVNNNQSNSKVTLKYILAGVEKTESTILQKTYEGAWQQVIIPINLGLNQMSLSSIKLFIEGCSEDTEIEISNMKIIKGGTPEMYIFKGEGNEYKELSLKTGTNFYYFSDGNLITEIISPDFYMTDNDIFLTYKSLFYSRQNNQTYYDLVYNNGTKVKSVLYAGIQNNNDKYDFGIDSKDIPNFYFKLVDIIQDGKWSVMEKQICFHYDESILKYYYETKTMISTTDKHDSITKRLSDENSSITYSWQNADGTFRAKKDAENIITEVFYDLYGNKQTVEIFKEGKREDEVIKIEYTYDSNSEQLRENVDTYARNGVTNTYHYNKDNLIDYIIQGHKKVCYEYDLYNEYITSIKNEDISNVNESKNTQIVYSNSDKIKYFKDEYNEIYGYRYNIFNELEGMYKNKELLMSAKTEKGDDSILEVGTIYQDNNLITLNTMYDTYGRMIEIKHNDIVTTFDYETDNNKSVMLRKLKKIKDGFSGDEYNFTYDYNSNIKSEKIEVKDKITNTFFSNHKTEYIINNNEKVEFHVETNNPISQKVASSTYIYKEDSESQSQILEDFSYKYDYDDCGRICKKNGTMTVYEVCQDCEAAGGVACNEVTGVKLDKVISYHEGTTLPKRFTYDIMSKSMHSGGEVCSFYYENSKYENGNIVNIVEGGMRYNENPKNSELRLKSSLPTRLYTYNYDAFNRLTEEKNPEFGNLKYVYNNGMLGEVRKNGELIKKFSYNVGRLTEIINNGKINKISYDYFGNMLNNLRGNLKYNSRNQMESYEFYDTTESQYYTHSYRGKYYYNYQGVRYKKRWVEEITGMSPQIKNISYYLNGDTILGEDWTDDRGNITAKMRYFYDSEGICGIRYDGYNFTLVRDSLGNISKVMYKGKIIGEYLYDAWGNCKIKEISVANERDRFVLNYNPFRYKSYYCDLESGLYYCNSRYYDPELCTWLSPDSVEYLNPESVNGLNLYIYCGYNPINYCDPNGHIMISTLIFLGLIAVGAIVGGIVAGVNSYNNGNTGWELVGDIFGGAIIGGIIGGVIGYFAAPGIAAMLSSTGTFGAGLAFAGISGSAGAGIAVSTVGELTLATVATSVGLLSAAASTVMYYNGSWPGDDPTKAPDGFEWRGKGQPGSSEGNWYNPDTKEILHPDLNHPDPIGPHWDFRDALKQWWRIFKNGIFRK